MLLVILMMKTNFLHKSLLTNTQVLRICNALENNLSANKRLSKTQLHKTGQSGGFSGRLLRPLLKTGLPLMKNVLKQLAKSALIPLELTGPASATNAVMQKKILDQVLETLISSDKAMISW